MKNPSLKAKFDNIDRIIADGKKIINDLQSSSPTKTVNSNIKSYIGGYATVAISGLYESCFKEMFEIRAKKANDQELTNFVNNVMDKNFRNPDYNKILEYLNKLDKKIGTKLKKKVQLVHSTALDSIVTNKNNIAHGKNSTITIDDVFGYHKRAMFIFNEIEKLIC